MRRLCGLAVALTIALIGACSPPARTGSQSAAATWLADYLRIDTSNPPGREQRAVSFLRRILHGEGLETHLYVSPEGRPNLLARLEADPELDAGTIVLLHHMDVVPAGPDWSHDPFGGTFENGRLWGRGAVDDKSLGISHLAAFLALHRSVRPRRYGVVFLAVADEERGGGQGTRWLLDSHPELLGGTVAVLGEGGINRAHGERLLWWGIEVAQKRPLWLKATWRGRAGHGSMLNLGSAPHQQAKSLARLLDRPLEYRVSPPVRTYLEAVAPYQSDSFQNMVASLDEIVAAREPHHRLFPGIPNYLLDTVQVNVVAAGSQVNVVPATATAMIDIRLLPDTDEESFLSAVHEALGPEAEVEVLLRAPAATPSSTDNPVYRCLARVLATQAPVVPSFIPGVTDSRYFRQRGIDAYGFSPFILAAHEAAGVHGRDERIEIAAFERGIATMTEVLEACVAP